MLFVQFTFLIGFILVVLPFGSSLPFNYAYHLMHACHSFPAHDSVLASHCIPAFHLGHASFWIMLIIYLILFISFWIMLIIYLILFILFWIMLVLVPSLSSGSCLPFGLYSCFLSYQCLCLSFCLYLSSDLCSTISFHLCLPLTSSCLPFTSYQSSDILQHSQNRPTGDRW